MDEFQLIRYLTNSLGKPGKDVVHGIGDDCAVLPYSSEKFLLFTTDSLVENIHFKLNWLQGRKKIFYFLGWKSIAVNVSDILAMAGTPTHALVSLHTPSRINTPELKILYQGIKDCARNYGLHIVGGNTARTSADLILSVSMLGLVDRSGLLLRSTARVNDRIYIQKGVGESSAGLYLLNNHYSDLHPLILSHLKPEPDINWKKLRSRYTIHSAIDISDGLIGDLSHILQASDLGCELYPEKILASPSLKNLFPAQYLQHILHGGEDYKILFTSRDRIMEKEFVCIGRIIKEKEMFLVRNRERTRIKNKSGFTHF